MTTTATPVEPPTRKRSAVKTILLTLVVGLVLTTGGILVAAATRPATFRVERSILVKAPPERIAPHINDLKNWVDWSPFEKLDPDMTREYSGADTGVGAKYAWDGDNNIGAGRLEITESTPDRIVTTLEFIRPMAARNVAEFVFTPEAEGTRVTWAMHGPNTFPGKIIQVFISMDDMCGPQFEDGLTHLKQLAEAND